ncbi:MAG: RloB family protein [bacterium]
MPVARVVVTGQAGDPWALVEQARLLRREHRRSEVETWVVFDRDEHPRWADAAQRARDLGLHLALSNPCIELWGLLLHQDQTAWIHRHDAQRALAQLHPGYHHDKAPWFDLPTVLAGLEAAEARAELLARRATEAGDPLGNPTTSIHRLIARMREVASA